MGNDDYMTPRSAWETIDAYLPKDKLIWEPFYGNGESGKNLAKLGCEVIHKPVDFFDNNLGDVIVSNPPFSKVAKILKRLKEIGKPFILIMSQQKLNTKYYRDLFGNDPEMAILVPPKRIHFTPNGNDSRKSRCSFDCFYYCWKMGIDRQMIHL